MGHGQEDCGEGGVEGFVSGIGGGPVEGGAGECGDDVDV